MKTRLLSLTFAAAAAAALFAAGCTSEVNSVEPAKKTGSSPVMPDKRVIADPYLNNHVRIIAVNTTDTPANFLKIQVTVQNLTSSTQTFSYRIEWFDQAGMALALPTDTSISRTIEGKETQEIVAIAPTITAKDFRIKFMQPSN